MASYGQDQYGQKTYGQQESGFVIPDINVPVIPPGDPRRQYYLMDPRFTEANVSLSISMVRSMEGAVDNYTKYVGNHKIVGQPCVPEWASHDSTTEERVIMPFSYRNVPDGFLDFIVVLHHYRTQGTGTTDWRVYCARKPYSGPVVMDPVALGAFRKVCTIQTSESDLRRSATTLRITRGRAGSDPVASWLVLTAENSDSSTRSALTSIDVWPYTRVE